MLQKQLGETTVWMYDAAGRTVSVACGGQTTSYSYDYEGRLTQIVYPNGATNAFASCRAKSGLTVV